MKLHTKYILILPFLIFLVSFIVFPTAYLWFLSLNKVTFVNLSPSFYGLNNFFGALTSTRGIVGPIFFSFKYALTSVIVQIPLAIGIALLINREFRGKGFFTVIFLLPIFTSPVLLGIMGRLMFQEGIGTATYLINSVLNPIGLNVLPLSAGSAFWSLIILESIMWIPFVFLFIYVTLRSLPREYTEAATIDGASKFGRFKSITLPYLTPIIATLGVIRFADAFKSFDIIYSLTGGGPGSLTTSYSIRVYEMAFVSGNYGLAAAAALIGFFVLVVPLTIVFTHTRRKWRR